jgi:hypothetical protein
VDLTWCTQPVARLLALAEDGERPFGLLSPRSITPPPAARLLHAAAPAQWFPGARSPAGALAGLWLYFGSYDDAHRVAQELDTPEGSYWHAIVHRLEPDAENANYWSRRTGPHPVHAPLLAEARTIVQAHPGCGLKLGRVWDAERFTAFCEHARAQPGSLAERAAIAIQHAEWRLLFAWCGMRP